MIKSVLKICIGLILAGLPSCTPPGSWAGNPTPRAPAVSGDHGNHPRGGAFP